MENREYRRRIRNGFIGPVWNLNRYEKTLKNRKSGELMKV